MTDATPDFDNESFDKLLSTYRALFEAERQLETIKEGLRTQLNALAVERYSVTQVKQIVPGLGLSESTDVTYNKESAFEWVMKNPFGNSHLLTIDPKQIPMLTGFLLANEQLRGALTLNGSEMTKEIREKVNAGDPLPYPETMNVVTSKKLGIVVTEKNISAAPAQFPKVITEGLVLTDPSETTIIPF